MLNEGQIIELSSGNEYIVMKVLSLHNFNYVYLVNTMEPHDILIGTIKFENDFLFNEIKDNTELEYVLTVLNPNDSKEEELEDVRGAIKKNGEILEQSIEGEQLDKDQLLMKQYTREPSHNIYGNDTFDRYMSHNLYNSNMDLKNSIRDYIKSDKKRKFLVRRLAGNMDVEKIYNDFVNAIPEMLDKISRVLGFERPDYKKIEEDYMKKLAA